MVRFRAYKGQSYGVDLVKLDGLGLRADGLNPPEPSAYNIYGTQVFAPCTGEVVAAEEGLPDMQVPIVDREHMAHESATLAIQVSHICIYMHRNVELPLCQFLATHFLYG